MSWLGLGKKKKKETLPAPTWSPNQEPEIEVYDGAEVIMNEDGSYGKESSMTPAVTTESIRKEADLPASDDNKVVKDHIHFKSHGYEVTYHRYTTNLNVVYGDYTLADHHLGTKPNDVTYKDLWDALEEYMIGHKKEVARYYAALDKYEKEVSLFAPLEVAKDTVTIHNNEDKVRMSVYLYAQYVDRPTPPKAPKGIQADPAQQSGYDVLYLAFPISVNNYPVRVEKPEVMGEYWGEPEPNEADIAQQGDVEYVKHYFQYLVDAGDHPSNVIHELGKYACEFFLDQFNPNRNAEDLLRRAKSNQFDGGEASHKDRIREALENNRRGKGVSDDDFRRENLSRKARSVR